MKPLIVIDMTSYIRSSVYSVERVTAFPLHF